MIKLIYCICKRPGMSDAEFSDDWRNTHAPIGARIPGLRRLVSHVAPRPGGGVTSDFDGVAELWFDSWEDLLAARAGDAWQTSTEDDKNFVDPTKVACLVCTEHEIPPVPG